MSRNGSGTFSIPNTLVAGNVVTASGHNQNYSDIASELTNSIAADGQTPVTGPIKHANGSAAAPSVTFNSDQDSGWYRKAANSIALSLGGADVAVFATATAIFSCAAFFSGNVGVTGGVGVTGEFIASATSTFVGTANFSSKPVVPAKSFAFSKIADGTANRLYGTDGSGVASEITMGNGLSLVAASLSATAQLPQGYINNCTISNNAGDATNDIDIAAGVCRDSTDSVNITIAASTKQLDANWVAGTSGGGRNSAVGIADGTYHVYAVATAAGVSGIYFHTSTTVSTVLTALQAETGGASYAYARLIGSIVRAGAAILPFIQDGDDFNLVTPVLDVHVASPGTSANTATLASMPTGVRATAIIHVKTDSLMCYVSPLDTADLAPSATVAPLASVYDAASANGGMIRVRTNTSAQVRFRSNQNVDVYIATLGWVHPRGKNS